MKNYILLALVSLVCFILAVSVLSVAIALLVRETYQSAVVVADNVVEGAIELVDTVQFMKSVGAF